MTGDRYESLKIVNIVTSGTIAGSIDIHTLSDTIPGCEYNEKRFPGAILRMVNPKCVALIFTSGKAVLTGFHDLDEVPVGLEKFLEILNSADVTCFPDPKMEITNIVCSYSLGYQCNLNKLVVHLNYEHIEYEPEQFPGLVYRIPDPKMVILVFDSGNIILTGGKTLEGIKTGLNIFREKVENVI